MATILKINRQIETIKVEDNGETLYEWEVATDDKSIEQMLSKIGSSLDRAHTLVDKEAKAKNDEERAEANAMIVRLQKRVITSVIGSQGYLDVLEYIGGEYGPADPSENIRNIGDIFAALCVFVYERCTSKQLREVGVYFEREEKRTGGKWTPDNRKTRRTQKSSK